MTQGALGAHYDAPPGPLDADRARAYARATNDDNPAYESGLVVPPVFGVVPTWPVFTAAVTDLVPPPARPGLLHAAHDMRFLRPLVPGRGLRGEADVTAVRGGRMGSWITLRLLCSDGDALLLEQYATLFIRSFDAGPSGGEQASGHPFPASARSSPVGRVEARVDEDQARRYRDASGDTNPIHVDAEVARAAGLPGVILHGLCTMAICGQAVVAAAAGGDPLRLRRLAVRFSEPVFPGADLVTSLYDTGSGDGATVLAFEATSDGRRVIKDGLAEVAN